MKRKLCNAAKIAGGYCVALLMAFYTVWCVVEVWYMIDKVDGSTLWGCVWYFVMAAVCVCLFVWSARQLGKTFWTGLRAERRGFGLDSETADKSAILKALRRACDEMKWVETAGDEGHINAALYELNQVCDLLEGKK